MSQTDLPLRRIIASDQLGINEQQLDRNALKVLAKLKEAGFDAYLVGGCIRDILLGAVPKDFDIATNARPEEISKLFRNCRLIGRRFRLAHIYFGREIIEVATFRATSEKEAITDKQGHVLEDNCYGCIEEDVMRRDFTINSLYYDVAAREIYDYMDALDDIKKGIIRVIGRVQHRYTQDPVRMLRAVRFVAKLGMQLEAETAATIIACKHHLCSVAPARLFDELQKLFMSGHARASFEELHKYQLFKVLFAQSGAIIDDDGDAAINYRDYYLQIIRIALKSTDERVRERRPVTIAFLLAAILWPAYQSSYRKLLKNNKNWHSAMNAAVSEVLQTITVQIAIPMRLHGMIREIWTLQAQLELSANNRKAKNVLAQARFRAAYDFLSIRAQAGENLGELVTFWQNMQQSPTVTPHKSEMCKNEVRKNRKKNNKQRQRR